MTKRKDVLKYFMDRGFVLKKGTNHDKLVHEDGRWTVIGRHQEINNLLFERMKKEAKTSDKKYK